MKLSVSRRIPEGLETAGREVLVHPCGLSAGEAKGALENIDRSGDVDHIASDFGPCAALLPSKVWLLKAKKPDRST